MGSAMKHGKILSKAAETNKANRPTAHLLYIVMQYNGNVIPLEQTLITQTQV